MKNLSIELILVICYIVAEIYKMIFKENNYKYIPIIVVVIGGILGLLILKTEEPIKAIIIGIISGLSSTGTNQIIKQLKKENKYE